MPIAAEGPGKRDLVSLLSVPEYGSVTRWCFAARFVTASLGMCRSTASCRLSPPTPTRCCSIACMDDADAELLNVGGITNTVNVLPAAGAAAIDVRRELLAFRGVASAQSVAAVTDAFDQ